MGAALRLETEVLKVFTVGQQVLLKGGEGRSYPRRVLFGDRGASGFLTVRPSAPYLMKKMRSHDKGNVYFVEGPTGRSMHIHSRHLKRSVFRTA